MQHSCHHSEHVPGWADGCRVRPTTYTHMISAHEPPTSHQSSEPQTLAVNQLLN
jgi:hypothetical protein